MERLDLENMLNAINAYRKMLYNDPLGIKDPDPYEDLTIEELVQIEQRQMIWND